MKEMIYLLVMENAIDTKDELKKQTVTITVHNYYRNGNLTNTYIVSPGKRGVEIRVGDDFSYDMEMDSRLEMYLDQGYSVTYKYLTSHIK